MWLRYCIYTLCVLISSLPGLRADPIDDYLQDEMQQHRIPGAALSILSQGQTVKCAAYGLANIEHQVPTKTNSAFEIGSVTKQFTAAAILMLSEKGSLTLDDSITKHLPNSPMTWSNITVRHLLTHTSGIKSYTGLPGYELTRHLTQTQFLAQIGKQPLEFAPGSTWKYSNTGYSLLGYIIENLSGSSYWDFLYTRIFAPLSMNSTTNRLPSLIIPNRVSGYEQVKNVWVNRDYDLTDVFAAGAIVSTVGDLSAWQRALDRPGLLNAESMRSMWTPFRLTTDKNTDYGFGWLIETFEGHKIIGHGGSTSGFSASCQRFADEKLTVILLTNTDEQIATRLARKIGSLYLKK
jgi:CubicO group peptidase (beta-lactamase class C family)